MKTDRRVVITGIGAVTPIGTTRQGLWSGVCKEKSAVGRITRFDPSQFRSQVAAEIKDFDPATYLPPKKIARLDRFSQFSIVAAMQAVDDAGLDIDALDKDRVGIFIGSALGGVGYAEEQHSIFVEKGLRAVSTSLALSVFGGASSSNISMHFGITGPQLSNANSCSSGTIAIGEAFMAIRSGRADVILAGGAEAPLYPLTFGAFSLIKVMSARNDDPETACRPFDRDRDGFVMGEGAAVLVLESLEHALRRNAQILGEIIGYASTSDAYHMTAPLPTGEQASRCMALAIANAGCSTDEIDYINAHGSSTPLNDSTETLAIKKVFGERAYKIPVSATKSMHGHALGASGAIEIAICCMALACDYIPATVNLISPADDCDLDYVPNRGRKAKVDTILSNSFGFGGINASIVIRRFET